MSQKMECHSNGLLLKMEYHLNGMSLSLKLNVTQSGMSLKREYCSKGEYHLKWNDTQNVISLKM